MEYQEFEVKNFKTVIQEKANFLYQKYPKEYLNKIKLDIVLTMGNFIGDLETNSEIEHHKKNILDYLDKFVNASERFDKTEILFMRKQYLEPTVNFLNKYEFYPKGYFVFVEALVGVGIDVVLFVTGLAKFYNYVPIFSIIYFVQKVRRYNRMKKEGKILNI